MFTEPAQPVQYTATAGAFLLAYYLVPFLLDPYDYRRRFSGPWMASFTNWWYSNTMKGGRHSEVIRELHMRYGTFVRIGPDHISIADPDALEAVYGQASGLLKSDFYQSFVTREVDIFSAQEKAIHTAKRKRISNVFSQQNILAYQPRVRSLIQLLCEQWDKRCEEASRGVSGFNWDAINGKAIIDCCPQFAYLAFDIIGDLALGIPFGLVEAQKDAAPVSRSMDANEHMKTSTFDVPVIRIMLAGATNAAAIGTYPAWAQGILRYAPWNVLGFVEQLNLVRLTVAALNTRLRNGSQAVLPDGKENVDIVSKLLEVRGKDGLRLSREELLSEAIILLGAGSDTTSNTLSALCYYLAKDPAIQHRLQAELDQNVPASRKHTVGSACDVVVDYEAVKNLPYLNACVKETFRLHSTLGTGLPRVVPPGKVFTFGGQTFKAGSVVSVPTFTTNRSNVWGSDAESFRPERWLEDSTGILNKYYMPFSTGPRACIGRNLALMDILLTVATIYRRYDIELAHPETKLQIIEAFARGTTHCDLAIKRRGAAGS